jgi:hypothetical protein
MPNTGNFNPEWGYLAPRPGFMRSFRMALVAGAIGTVGGMAAAVALIAHPAVDLSVAARTMAQLGESDNLPTNLPNNSASESPKPAASIASAEMLEVKAPPVAAPQLTARPAADLRDVKSFAAAESHSAATVQHPPALSGLAESPSVSDAISDTPSSLIPAAAPKKVAAAQRTAANVVALAEVPSSLRDDASAEMSARAVPAPTSKTANKKVQVVARVRTARADWNSRDHESGGPLEVFKTIFGFDHQVK